MKNNYIICNKNVIGIIIKPRQGSKYGAQYFILDDQTEIKARGTKIKVQCHKCGAWKEFIYDGRHEQKEYICPSCMFSGKRNPFYGKKHSQEFKNRLSKERKGIWGVGEKNAMYGKNWQDFSTPEKIALHKLHTSQATTGKNNPMYGESIKDHMTEEKYLLWKQHQKEAQLNMSPERKQKISEKISKSQYKLQEKDPIAYSKMKSKGGKATVSKAWNYEKTKPEIKLEKWLIEHNVDYDYSPIMGFKDSCYQYDFIIHGKRILIEVQGNYWHGDPNAYNEDGSNGKKKLNDMQKRKIQRDKLKLKFAIEKGFKLICIWESEINANDFSKLMEIL